MFFTIEYWKKQPWNLIKNSRGKWISREGSSQIHASPSTLKEEPWSDILSPFWCMDMRLRQLQNSYKGNWRQQKYGFWGEFENLMDSTEIKWNSLKVGRKVKRQSVFSGSCDEKRETGAYHSKWNDWRKTQQRKMEEKMLDGLTKCYGVGREMDTLKVMRHRNAWKVMSTLTYIKEQGTWVIDFFFYRYLLKFLCICSPIFVTEESLMIFYVIIF